MNCLTGQVGSYKGSVVRLDMVEGPLPRRPQFTPKTSLRMKRSNSDVSPVLVERERVGPARRAAVYKQSNLLGKFVK